MNSDYILQVIVTNLAEIILLYENYGCVWGGEIEKEREKRVKSERNEKPPF